MKKLQLITFIILISFSAYSKESKFKSLELFNKVLYLIESKYYRNVDSEKLIEGALKGMMNTLDPHSLYLNKRVFKKMQEDTNGEFGGLGVEVSQKDGVITVITPIEDSPAYKAGVKPGDKIVEINHNSTIGLSLEKSILLMKAKKGEKVLIGLMRQGHDDIIRKEIVKSVIKINPVNSKLIDHNYVYLRLKQFQKGAGSSISKNLFKLIKKSKKYGGTKGIILDLRNNPGGLLDEAVKVSSIFLESGVVVSTESRDPKEKEIRYVIKTGKKILEIPLVVLINSSSASASEIVTGALKDHKRALIMGKTSFGKGSVQTIAKISKNQGIKLTIAQYMTPLGKKIQAIGIKPDIELPSNEGNWVEKNSIIDTSVRERDLKNHLNATIETKEEKQIRLEKEKIERKNRISEYKKWKKNKKVNKNKIKETSDKDYWVFLAKRQLKSIAIYKSLRH